ncbi:MAG: hypothetical protein L0Y58_04085 [Verrucomicrobia subdivision 3 bacterium]|nr:hypothetical protein [Limisphaerales bacterium]
MTNYRVLRKQHEHRLDHKTLRTKFWLRIGKPEWQRLSVNNWDRPFRVMLTLHYRDVTSRLLGITLRA